jgi:hypothetical protein
MPPSPAAQPALLPGAPGPGPVQQAAFVVQGARDWGKQVIQTGTALVNRLHSGPDVSQKERDAFKDAVVQWRAAVKYKMNELQSQGRGEGVGQLKELLDNSVGPKLTQMRVYLGIE